MSSLHKLKKQISFTSFIITFVLMAGLLLPNNISQLFIENAYSLTKGGPVIRTGHVMARAFELNEAGNRIWAEIDVEGEAVNDINEAVDKYEEAVVISVAEYTQIVTTFNNFKEQYSDTLAVGAEVYTREEFIQRQFSNVDVPKLDVAQDDPNKTESIPIEKGRLRDSTLTVLVRSQESVIDPRLLPTKGAIRGMILFESPIDLRPSEIRENFGDAKSILMSKEGEILHESENNIGFKTNYYKKNAQGEPIREEPLGPIANALVDAPGFTHDAQYPSGEDGRYSMIAWIIPCPGFSYTHNFHHWAKLHFTNFNPEAPNPVGFFYFRTIVQDSVICSDIGALLGGSLSALMTKLAVDSIERSIADPIIDYNFFIDLIMLTGVSDFSNDNETIPIGETKYKYTAPPLDKIAPQTVDLNLDRISDVAVNSSDTRYYDIYLDGETTNADGTEKDPDLQRVADVKADFKDQGLLESISAADMQETDFYVYRVSNGKIVVKKEGLRERDIIHSEDGYEYMLLMPGPLDDISHGLTNSHQGLIDFQEAIGYPPEMRGRRADFLRPGEEVKIIAINRPTGYIGTLKTTIQTPSAGFLNFDLGKLVMRPPNLKVKVERMYTVQAGLSKNDDENGKREYMVGFEGGALTTDTMVQISTEWFDQDGTPLPEELDGYTGRLARVTGENSVSGGQINTFPIETGSKLQVLTLEGDIQSEEHLYIHVWGSPDWENPGPGAGDGPLQYRPKTYVPIKVPILDEVATTQLRDFNRYNIEDEVSTALEEVEAVYQWPYRPEMQFSVYDLNIKSLTRTEADELQTDIYQAGLDNNTDTVPGVASSDQVFTIAYDLFQQSFSDQNQYGGLELLGADKDLIFSFGEDEKLVTFNADQTLDFENISHLASLNPEDYLSIRLYQNNDTENILWEFAFEALALFPDANAGEIEVSADDNKVIVYAHIPGYQNREPNNQQAYFLDWQSSEVGFGFNPSYERNQLGAYSTEVSLPRTADTEVIVNALLSDTNPKIKASSATYKVVPGEPKLISVTSQTGKAAISALGVIEVQVRVQDQWGNDVADNTPITVETDGDLAIDSTYLTTDGLVNLSIKGLEEPGVKNLTFKSGDAQHTAAVTIDPINITVNIASQIAPEQKVLVEILATSPAGTVDGVRSILRSTKGEIQNQLVNFVGGRATTEFYSGETIGSGVFSSQVAGMATFKAFTVAPSGGGANPQLSIPAIMGDQTTDGTLTVNESGIDYSFDYSASSSLTVEGNPGEQVPVKIGTLMEPAIEPVLQYPMNSLGGSKQVFDRYDTIHASSIDLSTTRESAQGFRGSLKFISTSGIKVPDNNALDKPTNIGFSLNIKPESTNVNIVNYIRRSQKLKINAASEIEYTIDTTDGTFTIKSSAVALNQWHQVAAHYRNNELQLEVNGVLTTLPATGDLIRKSGDSSVALGNPLFGTESQAGNSAIILGNGYQGNMNEFRVIDWSYPKLATFTNGLTEDVVTIGSTGSETVPIVSTGMMGQRPVLAQVDGGLGVAVVDYLIPPAHASPTQPSPGFWARVSAGSQQIGLGIVQHAKAAFELHQNIAAGVFLGDTSTTAGAAADLIVGFVPFFGDGRDLALQSYYGLTDDQRYDELIVILSTLGLAADTASAAGVLAAIPSGGTSVTITVVGQIFKNLVRVVKRVARLIPSGPFRNVLTNKFRDIVVNVKQGQWDKLSNVLSISSLFVAVLGEPELREFIFGAIRSSTDFDVWAKYISGYESAPDTIASADKNVLDWFIKTAYAIPANRFANVINQLITYARQQNIYQNADGLRAMGKDLTSSLDELNKYGASQISSSTKFSTRFLRIALKVHELGGINRMKKLVYFGAHAGNSLVRSVDEVFDDLDQLDVRKFLDLAQGELGINHVLDDLGSSVRKIRQGATHHLHGIIQLGDDLESVELWETIFNVAGKEIGRVRLDAKSLSGIKIDFKSYEPTVSNLTNLFSRSFNFKNLDAFEGARPGQFYNYIVEFSKNNFAGNVKLIFDRRSIGKEGLITETLVDVIKNADSRTLSRLQSDMGLNSRDFVVYLETLKNNIGRMVSVIE